MILLIQIKYRNNSINRGNLLNLLPFCNDVHTDCIHNAPITFIHLKINQYLLRTMLVNVLEEQ